MNPIIILIAKLIVGLVLFSAWVYLTLYPKTNQAAIVSFIQMTLGGLVTHLVSGQATINLPQSVDQPKIQAVQTVLPSNQLTEVSK